MTIAQKTESQVVGRPCQFRPRLLHYDCREIVQAVKEYLGGGIGAPPPSSSVTDLPETKGITKDFVMIVIPESRHVKVGLGAILLRKYTGDIGLGFWGGERCVAVALVLTPILTAPK